MFDHASATDSATPVGRAISVLVGVLMALLATSPRGFPGAVPDEVAHILQMRIPPEVFDPIVRRIAIAMTALHAVWRGADEG